MPKCDTCKEVISKVQVWCRRDDEIICNYCASDWYTGSDRVRDHADDEIDPEIGSH